MELISFDEQPVQGITLDALESSVHENYANGNPCGGAYHFEVIAQVMNMLGGINAQPEIADLFVASNRDKYRPGVTLDREREARFGDKDPRSYIFRRVYCNITLQPYDQSGETSAVAISYSQRGISIAVGAHAHYCRNLTLLGVGRVFSNFAAGMNAIDVNLTKNYEDMMETLQVFFAENADIHHLIMNDVADFKAEMFTDDDFKEVLNALMCHRICHDTADKAIRVTEAYPLNSNQINNAVERYLISRKDCSKSHREMTWWDAFQLFNFDLKPKRCDLSTIIPQSASLGYTMQRLLADKRMYDGE